MANGYFQFCPIAKAAEIVCERWSPLILRELMYGARHFNEIHRGIPRLSRSLLAQRLRSLEDQGVLRQVAATDGGTAAYRLTEAGEALRPVLESLGLWAQQHSRGRLVADDLDDAMLMWAFRRHLRCERLPEARVVLQFKLTGLHKVKLRERHWWLVLENGDADVCQKDPGYDIQAVVAADLGALTRVFLGHREWSSALACGDVQVAGPPAVLEGIPVWLRLDGALVQNLGLETYGAARSATSLPRLAKM